MTAEEWLNQEEQVAREGRLARLRWMSERMPKVEWMVFGAGPISKYLFEEAKYSFAYGQYLGSTLLGLAFIERSLAGAFYASGCNDVETWTMAKITSEAETYGWISKDERLAIDRIRKLRNPLTHFRPPGDKERIETRASKTNTDDYEILEKDACVVMETVFRVFKSIVPFAYSD